MFGFGKKKKAKKQDPVLTHPKLGELKYGGLGWVRISTTKLLLWDRAYDVSIEFIAEEEEEITKSQEETFDKFIRVATEQKGFIEKMILEHMNCDNEYGAGDRFIPREVSVGRNGECVVFFEDTEEGVEYGFDTDTGFAMFLIPKLLFGSAEDYFDYLMGHGSSFTTRELYGE